MIQLPTGQRGYTLKVRHPILGGERSVVISGSSTDDKPDPFWAIRATHDSTKANVEVAIMNIEGVDVFGWCDQSQSPLPTCPMRAASKGVVVVPAAGAAAKQKTAPKATGGGKDSSGAATPEPAGPAGNECVVSGIPVIYNTQDIAPGVELRIYQKKHVRQGEQTKGDQLTRLNQAGHE